MCLLIFILFVLEQYIFLVYSVEWKFCIYFFLIVTSRWIWICDLFHDSAAKGPHSGSHQCLQPLLLPFGSYCKKKQKRHPLCLLSSLDFILGSSCSFTVLLSKRSSVSFSNHSSPPPPLPPFIFLSASLSHSSSHLAAFPNSLLSNTPVSSHQPLSALLSPT